MANITLLIQDEIQVQEVLRQIKINSLAAKH